MAPALAAATVGIVIGTGVNVARAAATAAMMCSSLSVVGNSLRLRRVI